jgi:formyl-CoA transferase
VYLDVAMLDTSMLLMASLVTSHLSAGWMPKQTGNEAWSQSPSSGAFETQNGLLMVAANNDKQFRALCAGLGRPDILEDERWGDQGARAVNAASLRAELIAIFREKSAHLWEEVLDAAGVPAARVRALDEVLAEGQAQTRGFARPIYWPQAARDIYLPTLGFKVDSEIVAATALPPELGRDTHAVLSDLGYSEAELGRLSEAAII